MQRKKLMFGVLALVLMVGIVSASMVVIQPWKKISNSTYEVYETKTEWTPTTTVELGMLYGAEKKDGSETNVINTTTYAPIAFYFIVSNESKLDGLQNWSVTVSYGNATIGTITSPNVGPAYNVSTTLSGSLQYTFLFDYSVKAEDYQFGGNFTGGTIIIKCQTTTPL